MDNKIRIGMIGTGRMAGAHSECHLRANLAELEVVAGRSEEKTKIIKENYKYKRMSTNWKDVVYDPNVDLIDITTPNFLHKEMAIECIHAGKDFIIEKPLAMNVVEADEIIDAAEKAGIKGMYAEDLRYAPSYVESKQIIKEGGIGNPFMIRMNQMHSGPFHSNWFWDAKLAGGGVVIDVGIHVVYCVEWLMGAKVVDVYARGGVMKWKELCKSGAEDTAIVSLRFDNGAIGEVVLSWAISNGLDTRAEIYGTKGNLYIDSARNSGGVMIYSQDGYGEDLKKLASKDPFVATTKGWTSPFIDRWSVQGHLQEITHFLQCSISNKEPFTTLEDGWRALKLVEAIYKSLRLEKKIAV